MNGTGDAMNYQRLQGAVVMLDRVANEYQSSLLELTQRISNGEMVGPIGVGRLLDLSRRIEALTRSCQGIQEVIDAIQQARPRPTLLRSVPVPVPPDAS